MKVSLLVGAKGFKLKGRGVCCPQGLGVNDLVVVWGTFSTSRRQSQQHLLLGLGLVLVSLCFIDIFAYPNPGHTEITGITRASFGTFSPDLHQRGAACQVKNRMGRMPWSLNFLRFRPQSGTVLVVSPLSGKASAAPTVDVPLLEG